MFSIEWAARYFELCSPSSLDNFIQTFDDEIQKKDNIGPYT